MIVDKNLTIDLNRVRPLKVITIHEGDKNSVRLVLSITNNSESVDLSSVAVKYDATIANTLAEQDATGSIDGTKAIIPITANMTAIGGILKIDVKFISGSSVLYTQTITMMVEKSVINGDTVIDASGTTIAGQISNLTAVVDGFINRSYTKDQVYTKTETDNKLKGKENFEYHQGITLEDLDNFTDTSTVYRLYIDGSYQLMICTSPTGCQFRFTRWGDVLCRNYNMATSSWGEWVNLLTRIPDNTISTAMIKDMSITYDKLTDDYCRTLGSVNLNNIDSDYNFGVHTGTVPTEWGELYDVSGDFILFNVINKQLIFFPENNKITYRARGSRGVWHAWQETTLLTDTGLEELLAGKLDDKDSVIKTSHIGEGQVNNSALADYSISAKKIQPTAVTSEKINGSAVTTGKIADKAVTKAKLAEDLLTKIDGAVTSEALSGKADKATTLAGYGITDAYTKAECSTNFGGRVKHVYKNDVSLEDCDIYTDWDTIYHLYINGSYQILMNSSVNGGQFRFTRNGNIYTRNYNHSTSEWSEWKHITAFIPNGTITGDMIDDMTITYDNLVDDYYRYYLGQNLDDIDNLPIGIYIGEATSAWYTRYSATGIYFLLNGNSQLLFFPENNLFLWRTRGLRGVWGNWYDAKLTTEFDVASAVRGEVGTIGENYAWYTDPSQGYSLTGNYSLIGNYCILHGTAPLIAGWERVYYSIPVNAIESSATIALCGSNTYTVATGTQNNISVLEIKQLGSSSMASGSIKFTLIYKYQDM